MCPESYYMCGHGRKVTHPYIRSDRAEKKRIPSLTYTKGFANYPDYCLSDLR